MDVNLPKIPFNDDTAGGGTKNKAVAEHVGFAFVMFDTAVTARQVAEKGIVVIKGQQCAVDLSVIKFEDRKHKKEEEEENEGKNHDSDDENNKEGEGDNIVDSEEDDDDNKEEDDEETEDKEETKAKEHEEKKRNIVTSPRQFFSRYLLFDASWYDVFKLFNSFGKIECIYVVKDKIANKPKGTAFVYFEKKESQQLTVNAKNDTKEEGLLLRERLLFCPYKAKLLFKNKYLDLALMTQILDAIPALADSQPVTVTDLSTTKTTTDPPPPPLFVGTMGNVRSLCGSRSKLSRYVPGFYRMSCFCRGMKSPG
mmetsp:Transcript_60251/g.71673  ORF Transcript_60251/g.71673 Transcript_60251/m.71673 type:complete len:311 (+) Transcript_60251:288-1220(+)|eukprot:CAMPEP_0172514310 /NCGR_PEP_ID=MMETSP1066-20121228/259054_1 /TAXON_ID=671091 /ORGANISM="Coscinodiscus wailesii, Strain CCMP2513" /LENGTH=310 /DNA_ID=CAMNT_0013294925 /DNA_START=275 /DNA_END=1207 /DNA_ORIENTATION=+